MRGQLLNKMGRALFRWCWGPLQLLRSVFREAEDGFGCLRCDQSACRLFGAERPCSDWVRSAASAGGALAPPPPSRPLPLREVEREGRPILEVDLACRLRAAAEEGPHIFASARVFDVNIAASRRPRSPPKIYAGKLAREAQTTLSTFEEERGRAPD